MNLWFLLELIVWLAAGTAAYIIYLMFFKRYPSAEYAVAEIDRDIGQQIRNSQIARGEDPDAASSKPRATSPKKECRRQLKSAREKLAKEFGQQAFVKRCDFETSQSEFKEAWKKTVYLAETKYGEKAVRNALFDLGYNQ